MKYEKINPCHLCHRPIYPPVYNGEEDHNALICKCAMWELRCYIERLENKLDKYEKLK